MAADAEAMHHPATEQALVELVQGAAAKGLQLRVRGATHCVAHGIYADGDGTRSVPNKILEPAPPPGPNLNVMLDRYTGWSVRDEHRRIVVAEAGIRLGVDAADPGAPSLLQQLFKERQWTLSDLGGIAHQTVSGFSATASAGGSIKYSFEDDVIGFRLIRASGEVVEIMRGDPEFPALYGNLGLHGVVSAVIFRCVPAFDIRGTETVTTIEDCAVDVFGRDTGGGRQPLEAFLRETDFARLEWWPQMGVERVVVWQAERVDHQLSTARVPYQRFGKHPTVEQIAICLVYTLLGNWKHVRQLHRKLRDTYAEIRRRSLLGGYLAAIVCTVVIWVLMHVGSTARRPFAKRIPTLFRWLLPRFVRVGPPQRFYDDSWHGLPMDNDVNDLFVPSAFTELWVPLREATALMRLIDDYFHKDCTLEESFTRTGWFLCELYAAKASDSWLSPGYTTGDPKCPWAGGAFRFNAYWFERNAGAAEKLLFEPLWKLVRASDIPFRLHWGKYLPTEDDAKWACYFRDRYPCWQQYLDLRARHDADGMFFTHYWRQRLEPPGSSSETCSGPEGKPETV